MKNVKSLVFINVFLILLTILCSCKTNIKYKINYHVNPEKNIIVNLEYDNNYSLSEEKAYEDAFYEKENYKKDGYYYDSSFNEKVSFPIIITKDIDLYLKWEEIIYEYNVNFYVDNELFDTKKVLGKNIITDIKTPIKDGYYFEGWYLDKNFNNKFDSSLPITKNTNLYAQFTFIKDELEIKECQGYNEGIYLKIPYIGIELDKYNISYSLANDNNYKELDRNLIRMEKNEIRIDILGLKPSNYDLKIELNGNTKTINDIKVYENDRSGYAHFNKNDGVGAYNNDGTLKNNTIIVYVTDKTKNTVTATINGKTITGLVNILNAQTNSANPLCIRILDTIKTTQFNPITYKSKANTSDIVLEQAKSLGNNKKSFTAKEILDNNYNSYSIDLENGITTLNNLSSKILYDSDEDEFDTYWNMCDIKNVKNVTVEGVGEKAGLYQWGFTWSSSNSIEVKNLTFTNYTEDACTFQGGPNLTKYKNFWVHNCTFNAGKNNWDLSKEQDKHYGDGATDIKTVCNVTSSYNKFFLCKKTGLVGSNDSQLTMSVTFHHNYYDSVSSRLPLGRQANMHFYNNYYYNCSTAQDIRANAFVLSEANYFLSCKNPQKVTISDTYTGTVIKSYNDILESCGKSQATVVTTRNQALNGNCKPDGASNYTNFDTNPNLFYYDSLNKKSNVMIMNDPNELNSLIPKYAGASKAYYRSILENN